MSDPYNRPSFPLDMDQAAFEAFKDHLRAGGRAPAGTLIDARSGEAVRLSQLWAGPAPVVLEFGSLT